MFFWFVSPVDINIVPWYDLRYSGAVCGAQAGTSAMVPIEVRYRFDKLPPATDVYVNEGIRITGGINFRVTVFAE